MMSACEKSCVHDYYVSSLNDLPSEETLHLCLLPTAAGVSFLSISRQDRNYLLFCFYELIEPRQLKMLRYGTTSMMNIEQELDRCLQSQFLLMTIQR